MSVSPQLPPVAKPRRRWRAWRIVLAVLVLLLLVGAAAVLAFRAYYFHIADERMRAAEARLDREDPRWRWEDILADRAAVPEEENSARPILAAGRLLPKEWPKKSARPAKEAQGFPGPDETKDLPTRLAVTPPNEGLDKELATDLRAELKALAPARAAAEPVTRLPRGRYEVDWSGNYLETLLPHIEQVRAVGQLFVLEAALQADERNLSQALVSVSGGLNTGRSLGDEPTLLSLLVRLGNGTFAQRSLQRVLGQGEVSLRELEDMQKQLRREKEETDPLLRYSLRGERGGAFDLVGRIASGEYGVAYVEALSGHGVVKKTWWSSVQSWLYPRPMARYNQAAILELMTDAVDLTRRPLHEQVKAFAEFPTRMKQLMVSSPHLSLTVLLLPAVDKLALAFFRYRASLDCAQAALAAERFRREHGRWPESLAELVPKYLDRVPEDPFDGNPVRYRRTADGVMIFSVGPAHREDPETAEPGGGNSGTGGGFRLWDVAQRGR